MLPQATLLSSVAKAICLPGILLLAAQSQLSPVHARSNISVREGTSLERRTQLEASLRQITGMAELCFDASGVLRLAAHSDGGSKSARALLVKAAEGHQPIFIEDQSRRSDVVFARVVLAKTIAHQVPVYLVQLDFSDFESLMGDELALKAFDVGWAMLHELDHVVEASEDPLSHNEVGDCEEHINQMRKECNLPLRAEYFHRFLPSSGETDFAAKFVRLPFVQRVGLTNKEKRYWVMWDAGIVGGLQEHCSKTWSLTAL